MAVPNITVLPTTPSRSQAPEAFVAAMDAFLAAFPAFRTQLIAMANYLESLAILADGGTYQVQSSPTDATIGRLLKTGASATVLSASPVKRAVVGGSPTSITLTTPGGEAPFTGMQLRFRASAANTGNSVIALNGGAFIACRTTVGNILPAGYTRTDADTIATFDGTYWVLSRETQVGNNANGYWQRFADGTQMVWASVPVTFSSASQAVVTHTWPAEFDVVPYGMSLTANSNPYGARNGNLTETTGGVVGYSRDGSNLTGVPVYSMFAIGRWY